MSYRQRRIFETELDKLNGPIDESLYSYSKEKKPEEDKAEQIEKQKELYDWEPPKDKVLLGFDWQGWPIYAETLKEILVSLGFEDDGEKMFLKHNKENDALLESFPLLLTDDGMGYGVNEEFICESDNEIYDTEVGNKKINVFNLFREKFISEKYECEK